MGKIKPNMYHYKTKYIIIIKENKINDISINKIKTRRYMISLSTPIKYKSFFLYMLLK